MVTNIFYSNKNTYYSNIRKNNIQILTIKFKLTKRNTSYQTLSATYNMIRDPIIITENTTVNFDYNYNNQRSRETYANSAKTKYYSVVIIHMNARIYDPFTKMFLQPDNIIQDNTKPDNYNRYGYCLNNPLKYTDPSGNVVIAPLLLAIIVGVSVSSTVYLIQAAVNHSFSWEGLGIAALQGAISGAASYGIGAAFGTTGKFLHELARALAHGYSQATISGVFGSDVRNFGSTFVAGAVASLVGSGLQAAGLKDLPLLYLGGALSGGIAAAITGGDFLEGAATGLIVTALNHGHEALRRNSQGQQKLNQQKIKANTIDKTPNGEPTHTPEEWANHYEGKTRQEIINEAKSQTIELFGVKITFPGGPINDINNSWRYVKLSNGNVLDMRHVLIVGMNYGSVIGAGLEAIQYIKSDTRPSSFNQQDYFSNSVGEKFRSFIQGSNGSLYFNSRYSTFEFGNYHETNFSNYFLKFIKNK